MPKKYRTTFLAKKYVNSHTEYYERSYKYWNNLFEPLKLS